MTKETAEQLISRLIRPQIREIKAYKVHDASGMIKLDAMENPYSWPPQLIDQWLEHLRQVQLNRYPVSDPQQLKSKLKALYDIPDAIACELGNGSDELIQVILMALAMPGQNMLSCHPGFSMYPIIAKLVGMEYHSVALDAEDFDLNITTFLDAIKHYQPAVIMLANPNNPTANLIAEDKLQQIIAAAPGIVVIDEAYAPFSSSNVTHLLQQQPKLMILRTLSKAGLAGLRLGMLFGHPAIIAELNKVRLPYNVSTLTQMSAEFALDHYAVIAQQIKDICANREQLMQALNDIKGLTVYPSETNFILLRAPLGRGNEIFNKIHHQGILIKNLHGSDALLNDCLRVTIGTKEENDAFLAALNSII